MSQTFMSKGFTRRTFLISMTGLAASVPFLQACQQAAPPSTPAGKEAVSPPSTPAGKEAAPSAPTPQTKEVVKEVVKEVIVTATPVAVAKPKLGAVELSFWQPPLNEAVLKKSQELMNQPQITVKVFSHGDYLNKLKVAFAAGSGPDLFRMNVPSGKFWMAKGIHMGLDPWIKAYPDFARNLQGFVKSTITSYSLRNQLMGVPFSSETTLGYYNATWFQQAGVPTPNELPKWTWETQLETFAKLSKGEGRDRVYGTFVSNHTQSGLAEYLYAAGGKIISDDGLTAECGSKQTIEAFQWVVDLIHQHKVAPEPTGWTKESGLNFFSAMANWKTAYSNSGEWAWWIFRDKQLDDKKFKLGFVEPPIYPKTNKRGAQGHTLCVAMYSKTRYPDEAGALLMPFATKEVQELIPPEVLPARIDAQAKFYTGEGAAEIKKVVEATQQYTEPYPATALEEAAVNIYYKYGTRILAKDVSVEEGLKQAEKEINESIQKAAEGR